MYLGNLVVDQLSEAGLGTSYNEVRGGADNLEGFTRDKITYQRSDDREPRLLVDDWLPRVRSSHGEWLRSCLHEEEVVRRYHKSNPSPAV
jgi:hypothetical protein